MESRRPLAYTDCPMSRLLLPILALAYLLNPGAPLAGKEPVDYVNPFIGAGSTKPTPEEAARLKGLDPRFSGFHGKLFPGACTPAGMVQLSPDTITGGDNGAGYSYPHTTIQGFSFEHLSGVGAYGDLGNFMVMPTTGLLHTYYGETDRPGSGYLSSYSKETEVAQAGYYAVTLDDYHVRAELTAAPHSGILRFTFAKNPQARIQIDLARRIGGTSLYQTVKVTDDHSIEGEIRCTSQGGGFRHGGVDYTLYYHAEFSRPLGKYGVWSAVLPPGPYNGLYPKPEFIAACQTATVIPGRREQRGTHLGFYAEFPAADQEVVLLKAGISYVSIANARANLAAEIPAWDFDGVRDRARQMWARMLNRISVAGGTEEQKTAFYTAFYHGLIDPRTETDVNGEYPGGDGKPHRAVGFTKRTIFSGWDVYRSQFPLLSLVAPEIVSDQISSAIALAGENGTDYFERWELLNSYTGVMDGSPELIVINDAYQKGIRNFDLERAYAISVNTSRRFGNGPKGFTSGSHGLAVTMDNAYDDWNLAQLAKALNRSKDAAAFDASAQSYRVLFNADEPWTYDRSAKDRRTDWRGWFSAKEKDGSWARWQGLTSGYGGEESSVYESGWSVPYDVPGLIELLGGKDLFIAKLEDFFERAPNLGRSNPYYDQTNEPSELLAFLFNRAGAPWLTQKWVRRLATETYGASPNGLCGDDDEGQVSSWLVLAASGLAQACPGDPRFEIFTPVFDRIAFTLDQKYAGGRTFVVTATNNAPANVYIQSATLNGQPLNRCWLSYGEITGGGTLALVLGPQPNQDWGRP
jgi:predicted alpha-1,2-mannosidase